MRPWIGRRQEFGIYDQLMMELRNEDPASFTRFLRMPPGMFDELLDRVAPRITKMHGTGSLTSSCLWEQVCLNEGLKSPTQHYFNSGERST